ncbi:MAG: cysteine--tRNA ligase [Spirochaetales bacterium]|nr:cysteine--tRNA ligase [Spirochaetales bacterium]
MKLYNTMDRKVEEFVPIEEGKVGMYCCGPTVYNYAHIGNLRTYIFEDILHRTLEEAGYRVKHVMNITDVGHLTGDGDDGEDKLGKRSRETGKSVWDIAAFYTDAFFADEKALNIKRPNVVCKATDHIQDMIALIKRLEEKGHTYTAGGNVYFSIDTIDDYGKLAGQKQEDKLSGARIAVDGNKRNPQDFVLWFTNSKFGEQAMMWDSPWGRGYPGWHIECSAMSMKYLGETFDIHCGGIDAIPVHHTNEIAQSEAATGHKWVNYWCHGEFLLNDKGKMSKSSGEFLTLPVLVGHGYNALDYRYFCLGGHYRTQLKFSYEALDHAKSARERLNSMVAELKAKAKPESTISEKAESYKDSFFAALFNDLRCPEALAVMWKMLKDNSIPEGEKLSLLYSMDKVLGLDLDKVEAKKEEKVGGEEEWKLVEERKQAKAEKNYQRADEIRKELEERGYIVKDTPQGPILQKIV